MVDLSEKLTVFLLTGQNNINLPNALKAIEKQSVKFKFEVIDGVTPLAVALQEMVNRCTTPYYIQLDEDMVLNLEAISIMYNMMVSSNEFACRIFPLLDNSLNKLIWGIKIFNHKVMSKYSYDLNSTSASVELFEKMKVDGYTFKNEKTPVGIHSPIWTPETIYNRYFTLTKKIKTDVGSGGYGDLYKIFNDRLIGEYNPLDFWALMGVTAAKYSNRNITYNEFREMFYPKEERNQLRVGKVIDQFGWAFYFIAKEMARYSKHVMTYEKYDNVHFNDLDIILISNPNICTPISNIQIPKIAKESGIKIIGQYCGEVNDTYAYADLIITISPQTYNFAKSRYSIPVIYLPESIDTNFFTPNEFCSESFKVGWAGRENPIKRVHLLSKLIYPIKKQANWGSKYFTEDSTLQPMLDFYRSIDCLVLTSASECQPRVVMEAMACGLPVISTEVGSIPMLLDKEWIVPVVPESLVVEEMNKKLKRLRNNPALREAVGKRNRAYILKKFSWEVNQKYWDEVFMSVYNNDMENVQRISDNFLKWNRKAFLRKSAYTYDRASNTVIKNTVIPAPIAPNYSKVNLLDEKLNLLEMADVRFWGLKKTCLYMINGIQICPEILTIGVRTEEDKNKILCVISDNIEVIVNPKQPVKLWRGHAHVPLPVVPYLANMFGDSWKNLTS